MMCLQCGKEFNNEMNRGMVVSISGSIMGDEYVETYFCCDRCGSYTVEVRHDRFLDDDQIFFRGPLAQSEGEKMAALIRSCSKPWDKKCRCEAHREYFGPLLD